MTSFYLRLWKEFLNKTKWTRITKKKADKFYHTNINNSVTKSTINKVKKTSHVRKKIFYNPQIISVCKNSHKS